MTLLSTVVVLLIGLALPPETISFTRITTRTTSTNLFLASRMPQFSPEEQAQLDAIMNGEYWDDSAVDYSDNLPKKRQPPPPKPATPTPPPPSQQQRQQQQQRPTTVASSGSAATSNSVKQVVAPNADWRSAASKPAAEVRMERSKPPVTRSVGPVDIDILDLDYDDFEAAMMEEDGGGFGDMGSKSTYAPEVHDGLMAGDVVPAGILTHPIDVPLHTLSVCLYRYASNTLSIYLPVNTTRTCLINIPLMYPINIPIPLTHSITLTDLMTSHVFDSCDLCDSCHCYNSVLWEKLVDAEGNPFKYARVHKDQCDIVVVYAGKSRRERCLLGPRNCLLLHPRRRLTGVPNPMSFSL